LSRAFCPPDERARQEVSEKRIIEAAEKRNDREIIEERKVAANDEKNLKHDEQYASDVAYRSGTERKTGHDELDEEIAKHCKLVEAKRGKMQVPADRARDWLSLVMIVEASEIAPAGVAA